ncbi:MSP domain-containing protein [Microthyrium microscopicum]|uniref:MSP domain-containing protein n=1 Tax=Microthyrium microscopicum TaxID=703497 RepID=A0A6A6UNM3_9PEZI|nr:MSP domain-containing protein [Microthyrium microscopicum]
MSLELEPGILGFKRPFTSEVSQTLRLKNVDRDPISFKVKTTAPKQYCVRPNSGRIEPGEFVDVSVVLQPMKADPPPDTRCKDKFLVQSIAVPAEKEMPPWGELERNFKASIQERKIRVHYLSVNAPSNHVNGHDDEGDDSVLSPPPVYTPHAESSQGAAANSSSGDARSLQSESVPSTPAQSKPVPAHQKNAEAAASPPEDLSREELLAQLGNARVNIAQLQKELDTNLRRRNVNPKESQKASSQGALGVATPAQTAGVPISTVALLCLFFFMLAYLLF